MCLVRHCKLMLHLDPTEQSCGAKRQCLVYCCWKEITLNLNGVINPCSSYCYESACSAGELGFDPGSGRSSGEENGKRSIILAWRIPWTKAPGGLQSAVSSFLIRKDSQRVGHN